MADGEFRVFYWGHAKLGLLPVGYKPDSNRDPATMQSSAKNPRTVAVGFNIYRAGSESVILIVDWSSKSRTIKFFQ